MSRMTKVEEREAVAFAEELLAQLLRAQKVAKLLADEYVVTEAKAKKLVKEAEKNLSNAIDLSTKERQAQHLARLEALYRRCLTAKKFTVCERVLKQIGRVHGVEAPTHVVHTGSASVDPEFSERSDAELDFFLEHDCWPEEHPKAKRANGGDSSTMVHDDPLKGLH